MQLRYRVHRATPTQRPSVIEIEGHEETVIRDALEVEMTSEMPTEHGTLTLRFVGAEAASARAVFRVDRNVTIEFTGEPEAEPQPETVTA